MPSYRPCKQVKKILPCAPDVSDVPRLPRFAVFVALLVEIKGLIYFSKQYQVKLLIVGRQLGCFEAFLKQTLINKISNFDVLIFDGIWVEFYPDPVDQFG